MQPRVPVLAAIVITAAFAWPATAAAQLPATTFDQAAASFRFPVWKPSRTLGLKSGLLVGGECGFGSTPEYLVADYRRGKRSLSLNEGRPICGNPDEATLVKTVRIHGARASVSVICFRRPSCRASVADGVRHGYIVGIRLPARDSPNISKARHTFVQAISFHIRLPRLLRVLRSLRPVNLHRPVVHLERFLSSDGSVWCFMRERMRQCLTDRPAYGGWVNRHGDVTLCGDAQPAQPLCAQNWDKGAPRLKDGQRSDLGGFVCADQAGQLTCTVKTGIGGGHGFHVSTAGSEVVGPAP